MNTPNAAPVRAMDWKALYRRAINAANGLTNYVEECPELHRIEREISAIEEDACTLTAAENDRTSGRCLSTTDGECVYRKTQRLIGLPSESVATTEAALSHAAVTVAGGEFVPKTELAKKLWEAAKEVEADAPGPDEWDTDTPDPVQPEGAAEAEYDAAFDEIDRYLRNSLDDDRYIEMTALLQTLYDGNAYTAATRGGEEGHG